eukprot:COSAG06_NODE_2048_length_7743_cov_19.099163_5_plen_90_part_00
MVALTLVDSDARVAGVPQARAGSQVQAVGGRAGLRDQSLDVLADERVVYVREEGVPRAPGHRWRGGLALRSFRPAGSVVIRLSTIGTRS